MATQPLTESARDWDSRPSRGDRAAIGKRQHDSRRHEAPTRSPALLARLIESEIIPRLLLAHQDDQLRALPEIEPAIEIAVLPSEVDELAPMVLQMETYQLLHHLQRFIARGVSVEKIFVDLLAPVARKLGEYWDEDRCDFIDVTMGLWRLQEIVHELSAGVPIKSREAPARRAIFAACPGDQHSFGTVIVDELFRRSGWDTARVAPDESVETVVAELACDLVGLTVSCDSRLDELPALIASVRRASRNPAIVVMVGGRVFNDDPALAARVGADGTAPTANQALAKAELLVEMFNRIPVGNV